MLVTPSNILGSYFVSRSSRYDIYVHAVMVPNYMGWFRRNFWRHAETYTKAVELTS